MGYWTSLIFPQNIQTSIDWWSEQFTYTNPTPLVYGSDWHGLVSTNPNELYFEIKSHINDDYINDLWNICYKDGHSPTDLYLLAHGEDDDAWTLYIPDRKNLHMPIRIMVVPDWDKFIDDYIKKFGVTEELYRKVVKGET